MIIKVFAISIALGVPFGVVAQEATGGSELPTWIQWSVLGMVIAGFITRQLVPGWLYSDIRNENKELKAENARLVQLNFDTQQVVLPALEAANRVMDHLINDGASGAAGSKGK